MHLQRGVLVVVQPGALELLVLQGEAQRRDQVQPRPGVGAQADDVAGVGRNFGLEQDDVEHRRTAHHGIGSPRRLRKRPLSAGVAAPATPVTPDAAPAANN